MCTCTFTYLPFPRVLVRITEESLLVVRLEHSRGVLISDHSLIMMIWVSTIPRLLSGLLDIRMGRGQIAAIACQSARVPEVESGESPSVEDVT